MSNFITIEDARKMVKLLQAYIDGRTIQQVDGLLCWRDTKPALFICYSNYRIKPDDPVPVTPGEWGDLIKTQGPVVKDKINGTIFSVKPHELENLKNIDRYLVLNWEHKLWEDKREL